MRKYDISAALSSAWLKSWVHAEAPIRIVTLSYFSQLFVWPVLIFYGIASRGDFEALLKNNWTHKHSHMETACAVMLCAALHVACQHLCLLTIVQSASLGVPSHVCAVMEIPCLHCPAQHAIDCRVGRSSQTIYKITFLFEFSQFTAGLSVFCFVCPPPHNSGTL